MRNKNDICLVGISLQTCSLRFSTEAYQDLFGADTANNDAERVNLHLGPIRDEREFGKVGFTSPVPPGNKNEILTA